MYPSHYEAWGKQEIISLILFLRPECTITKGLITTRKQFPYRCIGVRIMTVTPNINLWNSNNNDHEVEIKRELQHNGRRAGQEKWSEI